MDWYEVYVETLDYGRWEVQTACVQGLDRAKETARGIADMFENVKEAGGISNVKRVYISLPRRGTVYEIPLESAER